MKKNTAFNLLIIISIAALFRFAFFDKPEGLWNDEYNGVYIASLNNMSEFIKKIFENCHTPLYYFYLKFWMPLFGNDDISLRISSIIPSLISIPIIFYAGKEMKDEKTGYLAALMSAISSFGIFFAQEVRLYSLLILISSLICLYFFKTLKNSKKKNIIIFFTLQGVLCTLHTLGIIFCFFVSSVFLKEYLKYKKEEKFNDLKLPMIISAIFIILLFPLLYKIAFSGMFAQFWSTFSFSKIIYNITDYFSPLQLNISNSPSSLEKELIKNGTVNYKFIIFALIPSIIGLYGIVNMLKQKTAYNLIFYSSTFFYLTLVFFSLTGKMVLSTKYSCEIYPVLILGTAAGFLSVKKSYLKKALINIFIGINLFFLIFSPDAVYKLTRKEGHKAAADLIKESCLSKNDIILLTYYDKDRFERYINFEDYDVRSINKFNFNYFIFNNPNFKEVIKNGKKSYKTNLSTIPDKQITNYLDNFILYKTYTGKKVGILYLNTVSFHNSEEINKIVSDEKKYKTTPLIFLVFSALRNNADYYFEEKDYFTKKEEKQKGEWILKVYERTD